MIVEEKDEDSFEMVDIVVVAMLVFHKLICSHSAYVTIIQFQYNKHVYSSNYETSRIKYNFKRISDSF